MAVIKEHYHDVPVGDLADPPVIPQTSAATDFSEAVTFAGAVTFEGTVTFEGDVVMSGLPAADPAVAGQLWSNAGVLTVSAG